MWLLTFILSGCLALPDISNPRHPNQETTDQVFKATFGIQSKIVGGRETTISQHPWQAALNVNGNFICGAIILASNFVLTAAHCIGADISAYSVHVGSSMITGTGGSTHNVIDGILHEDFYNGIMPDGIAYPNDIAVLKLINPISFNSNKQPINLTNVTNSVLAGYREEDCAITGWGRIVGGGALPDMLQVTNVKILTDDDCRRIPFIKDYLNGTIHICVDGEDESGGCNGDSGGPLACKVGDGYELAGVTSFLMGSCLTSYPTVYAETHHFRSWIKEAMINLSL
ncbi:chymotrypsin-1-like [Argopecten irradians]|uniref:chymotrypsin-1-like n=1 Tax=Argopecten irradians TaxID=31199 RepID=UPI003721F6A5